MQNACRAEEQCHEEASDATIAIEKWVDRFELDVEQCCLDDEGRSRSSAWMNFSRSEMDSSTKVCGGGRRPQFPGGFLQSSFVIGETGLVLCHSLVLLRAVFHESLAGASHSTETRHGVFSRHDSLLRHSWRLPSHRRAEHLGPDRVQRGEDQKGKIVSLRFGMIGPLLS